MSFMCLEKVLLTYIWQHAFKHWKRKLIEVKTEIQNLIVLDLCLPSHQLSQLCWAGADFIGDLLWKRHRLLLLLNLGWWRRRSHSRLYAQTRGLELPDFTTSCNLPKMHQVEKESGNLAGHLFFLNKNAVKVHHLTGLGLVQVTSRWNAHVQSFSHLILENHGVEDSHHLKVLQKPKATEHVR